MPPDIPAVALTAEAVAEAPTLWTRVANGEFRIVYACEQVILDKAGSFSKEIIKKPNCAFMKNLCLITIDECHVVHDWQGFRPMYGYLGNLRLTFARVPWLLLSATLTPNSAAYVHDVCKLQFGTFRISLPLHRDNINLVVSPVDGQALDPLYRLIPDNITDLDLIPKTVIFYDAVDPAIDIVKSLEERLPAHLGRMKTQFAVMAYYGDLDDFTKATILDNFTSGVTRIVVCTDAFGLGIDIPDIARCVQWQVTEKLTIAKLCQRVGRVVRNKTLEGVAQIYASRDVLKDVPRGEWEEAWEHGFDGDAIEEGNEDDELTVAISRERQLNCFGIPVNRDTEAKCRKFTSHLYAKVKSLSEVHQRAAVERSGTHSDRISMSRKLDPPLLWFLTTEGCRHRVFGIIFGDPVLWSAQHRYWCCDNCALANGLDLANTVTHGISPALSHSNPNPPPKPVSEPIPVNLGPSRATAASRDQRHVLECALQAARQTFWEKIDIPDTIPQLILPDKTITWIVKHVKRITNIEQLCDQMMLQGIRPEASLLTQQNITDLMWTIDSTLSEGMTVLAQTLTSLEQRQSRNGEQLPESPSGHPPEELEIPENQENIAPGAVPSPSPSPMRRKRPFSVLNMIQDANAAREGQSKRAIQPTSKAASEPASTQEVHG